MRPCRPMEPGVFANGIEPATARFREHTGNNLSLASPPYKEKKEMSTKLVSDVRQPLAENNVLAKVAMAIAERNGEQVIWQCYIADARAAIGAMAEAVEEVLANGDADSIREMVDSAVSRGDLSYLRDQPRIASR